MAVTPQTNATLADIASTILQHDDFVLCGHVSPDGDCLGSQLALHHALESIGKRSTCVLVQDEPTSAFSFIPGIAGMVPATRFDGPCGVFVALDVPTRERIGEAACALLDAAPVSITVDHHASDAAMSDLAYIDPDAASASILVWELVKLLVDEPPLESAVCAYIGLVTDTGGFRFQNSDARAFGTAAELVSRGVDPAIVAVQVFQSRSIRSLRLEALAIERLDLFCDGQAALSWVTEADLAREGASKSDVEPLVDAVRSVAGVRVACFLREKEGAVRGNLRAKDETDVAALARQLGGGGHRAAAGFTLEMTVDQAIGLLKPRIAGLLV